MANEKNKRVDVRLGERNLQHLLAIKKMGDFGDDSTTLRFCISFTHTMFKILPAAVGESYIEEIEQNADSE